MNKVLRSHKFEVDIVWYGIPDFREPVLESTYNWIFDMAYKNIIARKALTC